MLQDVINLPEQQQLPEQECLSSPIVNQILDFCDDVELFPETLQTSEVSSCSGGGGSGDGSGCRGRDGSSGNICCYDDASLASPFSSLSSMDPSALVALLDAPDPEPTMTTTIDYSSPLPPPSLSPSMSTRPMYHSNNPNEQFNQTALVDDILNRYTTVCMPDSAIAHHLTVAPQLPNMLPPLPPLTASDDDSIVTLPSYMGSGLDPSPTSCSFMDPTGTGMGIFFSGNLGLSGETMYPGNLLMANEGAVQMPDLAEYHSECGGGMGFFGAADISGQQRIYTSNDMQVMSDGQQYLTGGNCGSPTPLTSDISSLEESTFKVGRLSVEERKEKIDRYMKKRNERNFSKKIKYACRKTLADSRPRVRGRFAKNDEFGETTRPSSSNHEDEDDDDVVIKEEDIMDSSDIFAHLNSFKCNYTLESWIS